MPRPALTLLLLLHYLLVACVSVSERPAQAEGARAFAYAHRADCQLRNAWRGGSCFDDCNGRQYAVPKARRAALPLPQLLAAARGLDLHCLPELPAPPIGGLRFGRPAGWGPGPTAAVPTGAGGRILCPPWKG